MDLDLLQGDWRAVRIETGGSLVPAQIAASVPWLTSASTESKTRVRQRSHWIGMHRPLLFLSRWKLEGRSTYR
jgi:hypothetical protein